MVFCFIYLFLYGEMVGMCFYCFFFFSFNWVVDLFIIEGFMINSFEYIRIFENLLKMGKFREKEI